MYQCEADNCDNLAKYELSYVDQDEIAADEGGVYYTMVCTNHLDPKPEWEVIEL